MLLYSRLIRKAGSGVPSRRAGRAERMATLAVSISDSATTTLPLIMEGEVLSSKGASVGRNSMVR